jgi:phosphoglycerate dehydrogenase-like enzyme
MKFTAILINVGRGSAVVQSDLLYAMKHKLISGAVLDATSPDPLPAGHPLRRCERVFLSDHQSAYSPFNKDRANEIYISRIKNYYLYGSHML